MAENVLITPGTGDTVAADDISSVKFQRVKLTLGADGVNDGDVSSSLPMPVSSSTFATSAKQDTGNTSLSNIDTNAGAIADASSATGSISAKLRFIAQTGIPITGTVTVGSHAVTVASGGIASGALASGSVASGAIASGAVASGAVASGAFASGSISAGAIAAGATSFVKLEDVASADADAGVPAMAILKATPADTAGTDGDYQMLQMKNGRLWASVILEAGTQVIGHVITDTNSVTNATLSAETTKVIGVVRNSDGSGNLLTSTSNALDVNLKTSSITLTVSGAVTEATLDAALISQEATTSSIKGLTAFGAVTTAAPTYVTAKSDALSLTTGGALRSDITTIAGTAPTTVGKLDIKGADGDVFVRQAAAGNLNATIVGTGTLSVQTSAQVPGTGATNLGKAEDAAHASGDTGVAIFAIRDDTLNSTSGTEGDYELLHTTADGALWVTQAPSVTNGWATFNATSGDGSTALTNTAQQVKASAGTIGGWYIYNPNAAATYVIFYNATSASVTVGTTNPQMVICIPATAGANVEFGNGITFATAMSIAATTTGGGNSAPATALEANIYYK